MIDTGARAIEVRNYIDGGWRDAGGSALESRDPATGELVATSALGSPVAPAAGKPRAR